MFINNPNRILRVEALFLLILAVCVYGKLHFSWWLFAALFFVPDLSIACYAISPRFGARAYNLFHSSCLTVAMMIVGVVSKSPLSLCIGLIWFAHIAFDRFLGYGLKYETAFSDTHLGVIGKKKNSG